MAAALRIGEDKFGNNFPLNHSSGVAAEKAVVEKNRKTAREYFDIYYYRMIAKKTGMRAKYFAVLVSTVP